MYSYWTIDKSGNPRYLSSNVTTDMTNQQLSRASYFCELTGRQTFATFSDIIKLYETATDSTGHPIYKEDNPTVFDFLRDAWEFITPLAPVNESKKAIAKVRKAMKKTGISYPVDDFSKLLEAVEKEYNTEPVPEWLSPGCGLEDIAEYISKFMEV